MMKSDPPCDEASDMTEDAILIHNDGYLSGDLSCNMPPLII